MIPKRTKMSASQGAGSWFSIELPEAEVMSGMKVWFEDSDERRQRFTTVCVGDEEVSQRNPGNHQSITTVPSVRRAPAVVDVGAVGCCCCCCCCCSSSPLHKRDFRYLCSDLITNSRRGSLAQTERRKKKHTKVLYSLGGPLMHRSVRGRGRLCREVPSTSGFSVSADRGKILRK